MAKPIRTGNVRNRELNSGRLQDDVPAYPSISNADGGPDPAPNMYASADKASPNALGQARRDARLQQLKDGMNRGGKVKKKFSAEGNVPKMRMDKKSRGGGTKWMQDLHVKKGAMTAAAKREGVSNSKYEQEHKHDSGKAGKRARLALVFKNSQH